MPVTRSKSKTLVETTVQVVSAITKETKPANKTAKVRRAKTTVTKTKVAADDIMSINKTEEEKLKSMQAASLNSRKKLLPEFAKGLEHVIKVDPSLSEIINVSTFRSFEIDQIEADKSISSFQYLVRVVIGQQVSGAAARSILAKFEALFNTADGQKFPSPTQVLELDFDTLRGAGLSARKAEYIRGIAEAYDRCELSDEKFKASTDDEVTDMLVNLKGIGPWTADMFLFFYQRRLDTFSIGDLGVQRGISNYIRDRAALQRELKLVDWSVPLDGLHSPGTSAKSQNRKPAKAAKAGSTSKWKVPQVNEMLYIANKFRPYRSVFQCVLWRLSDIDLVVTTDGENS